MTRPAIDYDSQLTRGTQVVRRKADGSTVAKDLYPTIGERRLCHKPASIKTPTGRRGSYVVPTAYSFWWGRFFPLSTYAVAVLKDSSVPYSGFKTMEWQGPPLGDIGFDVSSLLPVPAAVENQLLIKALNKLRNSNVNFGVALAEAKETAALFTENTRRIGQSVSRFRGKYPKEWDLVTQTEVGGPLWKRRLKSIPQGWLELQYGWNPLMADVAGACAGLDNELRAGKPLFVVRAKKKFENSTVVTNAWNPPFVFSNTEVKADYNCKVQLCYRLKNWTVAALSSLGLTNPLEIVWERVPYSFVVDWFLPVGNWLSAMGGDFGYDFVNGSYSRFIRFETAGVRETLTTDMETASGGGFGGKAVRFSRSLYVSSPWPGLYLKSPVSPKHIANALSLLAQAFRR